MRSAVAVLRAFNAPLSLETLEIPALEPGESLVRLTAAGVCGSDVHMCHPGDAGSARHQGRAGLSEMQIS
ncbi:MAG: hypothetical protein ABIF71_15120 [Planctomycetota bacterium]